MNNGGSKSFQGMPGLYGGMAEALWATWCLWSLQIMHDVNRAWLHLATGSCSGALKATRSYCESSANGNSSAGNSE